MSYQVPDEYPFEGMMVNRIDPFMSLFGVKVRVGATTSMNKK